MFATRTIADENREDRRHLALDMRTIEESDALGHVLRRVTRALELLHGVRQCTLLQLGPTRCDEIVIDDAEVGFEPLPPDVESIVRGRFTDRGWIEFHPALTSRAAVLFAPVPVTATLTVLLALEHDAGSDRTLEQVLDVAFDAALICEPVLAPRLRRVAERQRIDWYLTGEGIETMFNPIEDRETGATGGFSATTAFSGRTDAAAVYETARAHGSHIELYLTTADRALRDAVGLPDGFLHLVLPAEVVLEPDFANMVAEHDRPIVVELSTEGPGGVRWAALAALGEMGVTVVADEPVSPPA